MDLLDEIHNTGIAGAVADGSPQMRDELASLLAAQSMLRSLCDTHRGTEALKNDWQEFVKYAAACPACSDMLTAQAQEALSIRVFSAMLEFPNIYLRKTILCLVRLYMVLIFSPTRIPFDANLFRWVILGHK
jgi:hypothetical protein